MGHRRDQGATWRKLAQVGEAFNNVDSVSEKLGVGRTLTGRSGRRIVDVERVDPDQHHTLVAEVVDTLGRKEWRGLPVRNR